MEQLPVGTVTFLFTDIEGSTRLMQRLGDDWPAVIGDHNRLLRETFAATGGREVDRQGDAFFAVFGRARHGIEAAAVAQRRLADHGWPAGVEVKVRMGLHTGEPTVGEEGYLGLDVVRAARIAAVAHGGQVLLSQTTAALVGPEVNGIEVRDVGDHELKDLERPEHLYALAIPGLEADLTPPTVEGRIEIGPLVRVRRGGKRGPRPPTPPPAVLELPADWQGRERELAERALRAARELDLGALNRLGPKIERQVQEALRGAKVDERASTVADIAKGMEVLGTVGRAAPYVAAAAIVVLGLIGLVIYLVVRAFL
jgi:class 3 adenylate cyclase